MIKKTIFLIVIVTVIVAIFLSGCKKEKTPAPIKSWPTGTCEILDKLPKDLAKSPEINFGNRIKLLGVRTKKESPDKLKISYYWQLIDALEAYDTVFVHFVDKDDKGLFQNDHPFCQQKSFEALKGRIVNETYDVVVPQISAGQEIYVKMGLYDPKYLGRLKIESSGGIPTDESNTRAIVESLKL